MWNHLKVMGMERIITNVLFFIPSFFLMLYEFTISTYKITSGSSTLVIKKNIIIQ